MTNRLVEQVVVAHQQKEGGGFVVRRPFPSPGLGHFDPLLLLDEMGPIEYAPGKAIGAPDHPHRGFETVTYILEGEGAHADSAGHRGTIGPGDVQWMTAGSGVVHREMPSDRIMGEGGRVHGFQLWVNLPSQRKMVPPHYQEISASAIPKVERDGGRARGALIAGEACGVRSPVATHTPVVYQHWTLDPGAGLELETEAEHRLGVYVFDGSVEIGGRSLHKGTLAVLGEGTTLGVNSREGGQFLLLGGKPIGEPIAWMGPFVMNTDAELRQAVADFQSGRMGTIPPETTRLGDSG